MDYFELTKRRRQTQTEVQDLRRRMNHHPEISDARAAGDDGIARAGTAQQRADEAHSRFTNAALDAAHTRADDAFSRTTNQAIDNAHTAAEAAYKKSGVDFANRFNADRPLGTAVYATFLRHAPADGDDISISQSSAGDFFITNNTTGKDILKVSRQGVVTMFSTATMLQNATVGTNLDVAGILSAGRHTPPFAPAGVTLQPATSVTIPHPFGRFPSIVEAWVNAAASVRRPLPALNCSVTEITTTGITIANADPSLARTVGCYLFST